MRDGPSDSDCRVWVQITKSGSGPMTGVVSVLEKARRTRQMRAGKKDVWESYQRVQANQGSAGVDGESLTMFEKDLKGNLYKVWNRMSSGSYFPPPMRLVEIPKDDGGTRPLGIPTVADRVAQTVVTMALE